MDRDVVRYEDVAGVNSRVSWGAIFGGAVVALATYLLLTMFFAALGLSLNQAGVEAGTAGNIALISAAISVLASLYTGGCVTSLLVAGENRREAIIYGVLTWAVVTAFTLFLVGQGMRAGYNAVLATAVAGGQAQNASGQSWEEMARRAGVPQERIDAARNAAQPENLRAEARQANTPENRDAAHEGVTKATWITLGVTLLSIGASILGSLASAGPSFRLFPVTVAERRGVSVSGTHAGTGTGGMSTTGTGV